jgi:hypothetical protein
MTKSSITQPGSNRLAGAKICLPQPGQSSGVQQAWTVSRQEWHNGQRNRILPSVFNFSAVAIISLLLLI